MCPDNSIMSSEIVICSLNIYRVAYSVTRFLNIFRDTRVKDGRGIKLKNGPRLDFSREPLNYYYMYIHVCNSIAFPCTTRFTPSERTAVTICCSTKCVSAFVRFWKIILHIANESQFTLPHDHAEYCSAHLENVQVRFW